MFYSWALILTWRLADNEIKAVYPAFLFFWIVANLPPKRKKWQTGAENGKPVSKSPAISTGCHNVVNKQTQETKELTILLYFTLLTKQRQEAREPLPLLSLAYPTLPNPLTHQPVQILGLQPTQRRTRGEAGGSSVSTVHSCGDSLVMRFGLLFVQVGVVISFVFLMWVCWSICFEYSLSHFFGEYEVFVVHVSLFEQILEPFWSMFAHCLSCLL